MRALIAERLEIVRARLPARTGFAEFVWEEDAREPLLTRDAEAARAWGWIEGVADAEDVTVVEMLDPIGLLPAAE